MTKTKPFAALAAKAKANPIRRARIATHKHAMEDALALADLRAERGMTQMEVAETLGVTQANISRIEHEEDLYLSTLRGYVEGLGGELEVRAVFSDSKVTLGTGDHWIGETYEQTWSTPVPLLRASQLPSVVEAHLRADRNLDQDTASLLARMFHAAYMEATEKNASRSDQIEGGGTTDSSDVEAK